MKRFATYLISLLLSGLGYNAEAQTVTTNPETWATLVPGGTCTGCTITIPSGYTLNLASTGTCTGCTFTGGGTVNVTAAFKFPTSTTLFKDLIVNFNAAPGSNQNLEFTNDSVVINAAITWSAGITEISNSKFGVNAALKFQTANLVSDSFWLNNNGNISFSNSPDSINSSFVDMENGSAMSFKNAYIIGSNIVMNGNASIGASNNLYDSLGKLTMSSTASLTVLSNPTFQNMTINLNDTATMSFSNAVIFGTGSTVTIGDGKAMSKAKITSKGVSILNNSTLGILGSLNTLANNNANYNDDHGSVTLPSKTVSGCATLSNSGYQTCVLAVAGITLSATNAGAGKVALSWTDNVATNADHYLVERNPGNNTWSTIATIPAGAYSNGDYHFIDVDAPAGTIDYRIVWVDADGKTLYSTVSAVTIATTTTDVPVSIYPNPAIGSTFYVRTSFTGAVIVNVYTLTGQQLLHSELDGQMQYAIHLPSQALGCGTVVVQTIAQGVTHSFTVLVR